VRPVRRDHRSIAFSLHPSVPIPRLTPGASPRLAQEQSAMDDTEWRPGCPLARAVKSVARVPRPGPPIISSHHAACVRERTKKKEEHVLEDAWHAGAS
jgi:hypothetical protein